MQTASASDRQLETLRIYGGLVEVREDWGGAWCCAVAKVAQAVECLR